MDAEIGAEYLSKRGWSQQATFRMRPTADSYFRASYYGVVDRGFGPQKVDQGGRAVRAEGMAWLPGGFRGVLVFDHLSSLIFREAFAQTYTEAVNSEVHSSGFLTRTFDSFRFNTLFSQTENFQSLRPNDLVRLRALPNIEFQSVERPLWPRSPLRISWDSAMGWLSRREPTPEDGSALRTALLERLDLHPRLSLPLHWKGLHLTPTLGYRATHYGKRQEEARLVDENWRRGATTLSVEWVLPTLAKLYGGGWVRSAPFRHVIEPRATFRYVNGVGDFSRALLFDEQDLLTNTKELEYSVTQRLFVKQSGGSGSREVLSWELKQRYYFDRFFGEALVPGQRNVFPSSLTLSGNAFLDGPRRFSPVVSILRFRPSPNYDVEFREDYDADRHRFVHGGFLGSARWGDAFLNVSHFFVRSSPVLAAPSNQVGFTLGYGNLTKVGWNAAFAGAYDVRAGFLQFSAFQASYNNDCCGISVEFRRFALGPARNENQFRVAFSLANVGTFGTLKKQERLF
jgi:LPS-assembly protein